MLIRSKISGRVLEAHVAPHPAHRAIGSQLLVAKAGEGTFPIDWLDAQLYELLIATDEELRRLADAGYALDRAPWREPD
jgi:hypothetical protein